MLFYVNGNQVHVSQIFHCDQKPIHKGCTEYSTEEYNVSEIMFCLCYDMQSFKWVKFEAP